MFFTNAKEVAENNLEFAMEPIGFVTTIQFIKSAYHCGLAATLVRQFAVIALEDDRLAQAPTPETTLPLKYDMRSIRRLRSRSRRRASLVNCGAAAPSKE